MDITKNEIVKRWKKLNMLIGLEGQTKEDVAIAFEEMTKYLLSRKDDYKTDVSTLVFPIIRRIITNGGFIGYYTHEKLCKYIELTYNSTIEAIKMFYADVKGDYDAEATYCAWLCKAFTDENVINYGNK